GYALVFGGAGSEAVEAYARRLAVLLVGEDPTQVGRLWEKMYRADRGIRKVGVAGYALSALDIGLWDVTGKAAGLPLAKLWGAVKIPVATGENNYTRFEFRDLIERGAARYLMPDVCRANGFTETLRIGALAAAHQVALSPHVVHELSVHVAAALPNAFLVEFIDWTPGDLFDGLPKCEGGAFRVPDRPGHGIALGPDAEKKYRLG